MNREVGIINKSIIRLICFLFFGFYVINNQQEKGASMNYLFYQKIKMFIVRTLTGKKANS